MNIFLLIYVFSATWTNLLAINYFNIPYFSCILFVFSNLFIGKAVINKKCLKYLITPFLISIFYYFLSAIINLNVNGKSFNYALVYSLFPLLMCYLPLSFENKSQQAKKVVNYFFNGIIFIAFIIILEGIIRNTFGIDIIDFLPTSKEFKSFSSTVDGLITYRSRAFSSEPIIAGIGISTGLNYSILCLQNKIRQSAPEAKRGLIKYIILIPIFVIALIMTGSSAAFFCSLSFIIFMIIFMIINWVSNIFKGKLDLNGFILFSICIIPFFLISYLLINSIPVFSAIFENILGKLLLDDDYNSVQSRLLSFSNFYNSFLADPIGFKGYMGSLSSQSEGTAINWYLTILGDSGLIGAFFTLIPLSIAINISINNKGISSFNKLEKLFVLFAPIVGLAFHGTFYASLVWPLILVVNCL